MLTRKRTGKRVAVSFSSGDSDDADADADADDKNENDNDEGSTLRNSSFSFLDGPKDLLDDSDSLLSGGITIVPSPKRLPVTKIPLSYQQ